MEFNPSKCVHLRITNKRKIISSSYDMAGQKLSLVNRAKYLGLTIDGKLSWKPHVESVTAKANFTRYFLQRNLSACSLETKKLCYTSLVRSIVEYAATVWDPVDNSQLEHNGPSHFTQCTFTQNLKKSFYPNSWSLYPNILGKMTLLNF